MKSLRPYTVIYNLGSPLEYQAEESLLQIANLWKFSIYLNFIGS